MHKHCPGLNRGRFRFRVSSSPARMERSCEQGTSTHSQRETTWECRICLDELQDPVCTLCGHLFCWPCLYQWLRGHPKPCPVCKFLLLTHNFNVIPVYTGTEFVNPGASPVEANCVEIPARPQPMLLLHPNSSSVQTSRNDLHGTRVETRRDMITGRGRVYHNQPVTRSGVGRSGDVSGEARATSIGLGQHRSPAYEMAFQAVRGLYERREIMYQGTINRMVPQLTELTRENSRLRRDTESLQRQLAALRRCTCSRRGDSVT